MSQDVRARGSRSRPRAFALFASLLAATAALALLLAAGAPAAIQTGTIDPASGFPFAYTDDTDGLALQLCQDASGNCIETPRPLPDQPISVPDNFTPDAEGFYSLADANLTIPGAARPGLARFGKEAAFDTPDAQLGHQITFSRIRFRFTALTPNATYRITHPYGTTELQADAAGGINSTDDAGCIVPPCGAFPPVAGDRITTFLRWDPTVAPAAPAGYVGQALVPHKVIGSPLGQNFVRLERLDPAPVPGDPPVPVLIAETSDFLVQGKIAGAAPPPAAHLGVSSATVSFGSRPLGSPSGQQTVTVTNHGTANMTVGSVGIGGVDAAEFAKDSDACTGRTMVPGDSCAIAVRFLAGHVGGFSATLRIPSDAPHNPHSVSLSGTAVVPPPPAPPAPPAAGPSVITRLVPGPTAGAVGVLGARARAFAVTNLAINHRISRARLKQRGLRLTMRLPAGTQIVRLAVYRFRDGKRSGNALATATRLPTSTTGLYTVTLRNKRLLNLSRGRYVVLVTPSRDQGARGVTRQVTFTVD